jgi:hypothetical protein
VIDPVADLFLVQQDVSPRRVVKAGRRPLERKP